MNTKRAPNLCGKNPTIDPHPPPFARKQWLNLSLRLHKSPFTKTN